ncbi:MAG: hypothetical protein KF824_05090 [Fimbriimonadaceae bacterium]|nr:MAG: hypothetical protein KF824_05090 [Fimbriimonadaceae bacterium]
MADEEGKTEDWAKELAEQIRQQNILLEKQLKFGRNWRVQVRNGLVQGFSFAVGASILVSTIIWLIKPLKGIEALRPAIEQLSQDLQRRGR